MSEANRLPPWLAANTSATSNKPLFRQVLKILLIMILVTGGVGAVGWGLAQLVEYSQVPLCWQPALTNNQPTPPPLSVDVSGQVNQPGVYQLQSGQRLADAIKLAGGLTGRADQQFIDQQLNLATILEDGQKIYIPTRQVRPTGAASIENNDSVQARSNSSQTSPNNTEATDQPKPTGQASQSDLISINHASQTKLETLYQIGEKRAAKIIQNRPFLSITELVDKEVISQSVFDKIKKQISL